MATADRAEVATRETGRQTEREAMAREPELVHHPGPRQYVWVAVWLAIATLLEVGLYYVEGIPRGIVIGLLLFLMVVKFALVVLWFMHLRFDSPLFRRLFVAGLGLAIGVYMVVLVIMGALQLPGLLVVAAVLGVVGVVLFIRSRRARVQYEAEFLGPTPGRAHE